MSATIGEILGEILSDKESSEGIAAALGKLGEKGKGESSVPSPAAPQSEKQLMLQKKIDILQALKPMLGEEFSKKADLIINALTAAKIIIGLKNETQQ